MDIYDIMQRILSGTDLFEAARNLSLLADIALHEKNKNQIAEFFKTDLMDLQLLNSVNCFGFPGFISNKKKTYLLLINEKAIQQYLTLRINCSLTPVKFFKSLKDLSQEILEDFTEPSGRRVSPSFIEEIFDYLNTKLNFTKHVYRKSIPTFVLLDYSHRKLNAVTALTDNSDERSQQFVFLYHLQPESEFTPEFSLLHELGHIVQNRYGSFNTPPKSFYQFIKKESLERLDSCELCEIFADFFAMAMMCDTAFSQYDTIDEVSLRDKQVLKDYFSELIG